MGVPKLWSHLNPASTITTFAQLSEDGFRTSPGLRGLRVGIDVSAWIYANAVIFAEADRDTVGPNPELRNFFFKICRLKGAGLLPVVVFDGPLMPRRKRGHSAGHQAGLSYQEREWATLAKGLGCEVMQAAGEAEAELSSLAMKGLIDGVITDDVDALVFGAPLVIRNTSKELTGNQANFKKAAKDSEYVVTPDRTSKFAVTIYREKDIVEKCGIDRAAMILFAVLSGGDYVPEGIKRMGDVTAIAMGKLGFGAQLLEGLEKFKNSPTNTEMFLKAWRTSLGEELKTNKSKMLSKRMLSVGDSVLQIDDYPTRDLVESYSHPAVTPSPKPFGFAKRIDLEFLVPFVSSTFEWSHGWIQSYLRNNLYKALLHQEIRDKALLMDASLPRQVSPNGGGIPGRLTSSFPTSKAGSPPLSQRKQYSPPSSSLAAAANSLAEYIAKIHNKDCQDSTENVEAYRIELKPDAFAPFITALLPEPDPFPLDDSDDEPSPPPPTQSQRGSLSPIKASQASNASPGKKRKPAEVKGRTALSHWVSKEFLQYGAQGLILAYEEEQTAKKEKKIADEQRKKKRALLKLTKAEEKEEEKKVKKEKGKGKAKTPAAPKASTSAVAKKTKAVSGAKKKLLSDSEDESSQDEVRTTTPGRFKVMGGADFDYDKWLNESSDSGTEAAPKKATKSRNSSSKAKSTKPSPSSSSFFSDDELAGPSKSVYRSTTSKETRPLSRESSVGSDSHIRKSPKKVRKQVARERPASPTPVLELSDSNDEKPTGEAMMGKGKQGASNQRKGGVRKQKSMEVIDLCSD